MSSLLKGCVTYHWETSSSNLSERFDYDSGARFPLRFIPGCTTLWRYTPSVTGLKALAEVSSQCEPSIIWSNFTRCSDTAIHLDCTLVEVIRGSDWYSHSGRVSVIDPLCLSIEPENWSSNSPSPTGRTLSAYHHPTGLSHTLTLPRTLKPHTTLHSLPLPNRKNCKVQRQRPRQTNL